MVSKNKKSIFSNHEISMLGIRSNLVQASFSYERMHSLGWTWAQLPYWEKIYRDDPEGLKRVMTDNWNLLQLATVISHSHGATVNHGRKSTLIRPPLRVEERVVRPMAGIGDAIFWFTIMPIVGGISASIAKNGNVFGPILFFVVYLFLFWSRAPLAHLGYNLGTKAIDVIQENSTVISHVASILGLTVIGSLIASYVKMQLTIKIGPGTPLLTCKSNF